jgi:hypothetical protein
VKAKQASAPLDLARPEGDTSFFDNLNRGWKISNKDGGVNESFATTRFPAGDCIVLADAGNINRF